MDADCKVRKHVSYDQLNALIEFLKEHQDLAKGLARGRRGKFHTLKLWNHCAKKLNAIKDGAVKNEKGWSKFWCDWKYRVRRRALEMKVAKENNRPLPEGTVPLSPMEESILSIIGESAIDGVVIKSDPLGAGDTDDEEQDSNEHPDDVAINQFYGAPSRSRRQKRRLSSKDHMSDLDDRGGPSSPIEKKHRAADENGHFDDSDRDDEAGEFLRLEREKLDNSKRIAGSLQTIRTEITRLADIMGDIRDLLSNNRINL